MGKQWKHWQILFSWAPKYCSRWLQPSNEKTLAPWKKSYDKPRQHIKKQRYHFADKDLCSQSYGFSRNHVGMWELDHREGWVPKNWCIPMMMLENALQSPLDCMEIKPVNPKGNQPWICIGRTDAEAEAPILWLPDVKSRLIGRLLLKLKLQSIGHLTAKSWLTERDPDAGKDWRQKEKGVAEDEMVR